MNEYKDSQIELAGQIQHLAEAPVIAQGYLESLGGFPTSAMISGTSNIHAEQIYLSLSPWQGVVLGCFRSR